MIFIKFQKVLSLFIALTLMTTSATASFAEESTESNDSFYREANPFLFEEPRLERLQGSNDYETAAKVADKLNYSSAILVNLDNTIADGLSASGLSGTTNSPILLTQQNEVPNVTMQRLNKVNKVYIIGGINSVSSNIENKLKSQGISVIRIQGNDRYDTSIQVAKEIEKHTNSKYAFLVNGSKGDADAISISPVASMYKSPIILTNGNETKYSTSGKECYVIGGENSMSNLIVEKHNAVRISGEDRFKTNEEVINNFLDTDSYAKLVENEELGFYIVDGYNLRGGLLASTISKDSFFNLVSKNSEKGHMFVANKIVACGTLDESIIKESLNPYPVYKNMFGMWISELNSNKELSVDPEHLMAFIDGNPEDTNFENMTWNIKSVNQSNQSVIIENIGTNRDRYTKLQKLSDTRLKLETSSDMNNWRNTEYFTSVFSEAGQRMMFNTEEEFKMARASRVIRICKVETLGHVINVGLSIAVGDYGVSAVQKFVLKKGKQAARRIFTRTVTSRLCAKGASKLSRGVSAAVAVIFEWGNIGYNAAKTLEKIDAKPNNRYIEVPRW